MSAAAQSVRTLTPVLDELLRELADADDATRRELAKLLLSERVLAGCELLDARQKAKQLQLHPDTVIRLARGGRLPGQKVGREWRFTADSTVASAPTAARTPFSPGSPRIVRRSSDAAADAIRSAGKRCG